MDRLITHYDNLRVARNAPPEVIKAAYRTLSQKYHPDKNIGNPDAAKVMAIINKAYEILSDPAKRSEHDAWITEKETAAFATINRNHKNQVDTGEGRYKKQYGFQVDEEFLARYQRAQRSGDSRILIHKLISHIKSYWIIYLMFGLLIFNANNSENKTQPPAKPYSTKPPAVTQKPAYIRPSLAPNGKPWPKVSSYLEGVRKGHTSGYSKVTIDNSKNGSDVFVKLVSIDGSSAYPVREFFIVAYGSFTLNKITSGSYDIRYRDLDSGALSRSEPFSLEETNMDDGVQFSTITMTLYKIKNGNMKTYTISESEF